MKIRYLFLAVVFLIFASVMSAEARMRFIRLAPGDSISLDDIVVQCGDYKAYRIDEIDIEKSIDKKLERKKINLNRKIAEYKKNGDKLGKFCAKISFKREKEECSKIKVTYLESGAVKICEGMSFDKGRLECIKAIVDKVYSDSEINLAAQGTMEKDKINLLNNSGINIKDLQKED